MRRQPAWRRPRSLDGLEAERRAGKVRGPTRLSQQARPSALRVHTSLVKPGPLPAATATPLPVAAAAGTTVPRPRRSEGASLGGGARRCLVQRPRAARKTCGRHVGTQPRAAGRAGRRPWKGRGHCPWPGPLVCAADAHTGRAPVPTGREALAAPPPSSALCGLPAVGFSWMWARSPQRRPLLNGPRPEWRVLLPVPWPGACGHSHALDGGDGHGGPAASLPLTVPAAGRSASPGRSFPGSGREGPRRLGPLRPSSDCPSRVCRMVPGSLWLS